jgi:hypothetical protein
LWLAGVTMNDADRKAGKKNSDFRTSETYWMHSSTDWIKEVDKRVANLTRTPVGYQVRPLLFHRGSILPRV